MSFFRTQLESWLKTIHVEGGVVYDVGGAERPLSDKRLGTFQPERYAILDLPDYNVESETWVATRDGDAVFCLEVFEYLLNPGLAMRNLARLLRPGGVLYVSFPFVYPFHKPTESDMLRYTRSAVLRLCDEAKLTILDLVERRHKNPFTLIRAYQEDGMHIAGDEGVTGWLVKARKL